MNQEQMGYGLDMIKGKMPSLSEPVVFIDFDDVINVFDAYRDEPDIAKATVFIKKGTNHPGGGPIPTDKELEIAWRPKVVERLRNMNCVWLTSWKALTQELLNPVLEFDFGYVDWYYRGLSDSGFYGKLLSVQKFAEDAKVPVAVLDDSFHFYGGSLQDSIKNVSAFSIAPNYSEGLTLTQLDELDMFITENC